MKRTMTPNIIIITLNIIIIIIIIIIMHKIPIGATQRQPHGHSEALRGSLRQSVAIRAHTSSVSYKSWLSAQLVRGAQRLRYTSKGVGGFILMRRAIGRRDFGFVGPPSSSGSPI